MRWQIGLLIDTRLIGRHLRPGDGLAIVEEGEFQVKVGVFRERKTSGTPTVH